MKPTPASNTSSFSRQLRWAFTVLTFFSLIQAALTLWVAQESDYHIEKGRVSNRILTEFIDLGGNKQRLKVWLAQYLLTNDSSIDVKNNLLFKMNNSLSNLDKLLSRDQELNIGQKSEQFIISEQVERYKTLKININKLEEAVTKIDKNAFRDPGQAWKFMIQIFDSLDGNDLRKLINDAIEIQKLRASDAESNAKNYITYFNTSVYILTAFLVALSITLSILMQRAIQEPIQQLVQAAIEFSKGNMSYRIQNLPTNEFGILGQKFNELALELENFRQDEIKKRAAIEIAVEQRTQELKQAVEKLQQAEFERKIFLSNISHELKTPATAILGEASVTLRGSDKNLIDYKDSLKSIQIIGRQLSNRIDDLLLLARTDSDFFRIHLNPTPAKELKSHVQEALSIVDSSASVQFELSDQLTNDQILIDKDRFVQMAVILLDNAVHYHKRHTPIQIDLFIESGFFVFKTSNKSENLESINPEKIFERYYRSHHSRVIRPDGLGIGLHLAQTIVKAHYGRIKASTLNNETFEVRVELPIKV